MLDAVEEANTAQKKVMLHKLIARFGENLSGRHFALWGLAFKPNTDDMREAPSRVVIDELLQLGATITAYDPVAIAEARRLFDNEPRLSYAANPGMALLGADALVIVTEWKEFQGADLSDIKLGLRQPIVFDGRNIYDPALVHIAGLEYFPIGRAGSRIEHTLSH